jgi:hypothetical protein
MQVASVCASMGCNVDKQSVKDVWTRPRRSHRTGRPSPLADFLFNQAAPKELSASIALLTEFCFLPEFAFRSVITLLTHVHVSVPSSSSGGRGKSRLVYGESLGILTLSPNNITKAKFIDWRWSAIARDLLWRMTLVYLGSRARGLSEE